MAKDLQTADCVKIDRGPGYRLRIGTVTRPMGPDVWVSVIFEGETTETPVPRAACEHLGPKGLEMLRARIAAGVFDRTPVTEWDEA